MGSLSLNFDAAAVAVVAVVVVIYLCYYTSFIPPNLQLEIIKEQTRIDWSTLAHTHLHTKLKIIGFFSSHIIVTSCKCGFAKLPLTIAPNGWWKSKNIKVAWKNCGMNASNREMRKTHTHRDCLMIIFQRNAFSKCDFFCFLLLSKARIIAVKFR